jgi:serine/threonine-protein kinase HipA
MIEAIAMPDALEVFLHDERIATVTPTTRRTREQVALTWDDDFQPGSVRLTESFAAIPGSTPSSARVSSFLGGYAPEGNQRQALTAERGIEEHDLFGILQQFGGSIAGALTFRLPGEPPRYHPAYDEIGDAELGRALRRSVEKHDLGLHDDSRSMIQGFQPKLLLARFDGAWFQPHGRAHSTHILKPQLSSNPHKIVDEFYSHQLSRAMGLSRFASELRSAGHTKYLAIQRFDRQVVGDRVGALHQEDAAQALGLGWIDSNMKFQSSNRPRDPRHPSAYAIAELVAGLNGEGSLLDWLRQLTFRVLVGDNDGHAKNVGILHLPGEDTLTELYDAVPNLYQAGRIDWTMALAVHGQFDHRRISAESLADEASSWGVLRRGIVEQTIFDVLHRFEGALNSVPVPTGISDGLRAGLEWNLTRLLGGHEISEPKR